MDTGQQEHNIEFVNTGLNIRVDPKRVPPGGFQFLQNIISEQEGGLTVRRGRKKLGTEPGANPHTYSKFVVGSPTPGGAGEIPGTPSINFRYIGDGGTIYRTQDFLSFTNVSGNGISTGQSMCTTPTTGTLGQNPGNGALSPMWHAETFNAGTSGQPTQYFATQNYMVKDTSTSGSPNSKFYKWGGLPAFGVATALAVQVTNATNASPIVITTNIPHRILDGQTVGIAGVLGNTGTAGSGIGANGTFLASATGNTSSPPSLTSTTITLLNLDSTNSTGGGAYTSGGLVANLSISAPSGGGAGAIAGSTPYKYVYTYANSQTGQETNPSQAMIATSAVVNGVSGAVGNGTPVNTFNNYIQVSGLWGTDDWTSSPGVGPGQFDLVYLYRQGGTVADGLYHRVQQFPNVALGQPVLGTSGTYNDFCADTVAETNPSLNLFPTNDPPVPSTAPKPFIAQIQAGPSGTVGPGRVTNFTVNLPFFQATPGGYGATRGSLMHISGGEDCFIEDIADSLHATVYLQQSYTTNTYVEVDTICNQPCTLVCQGFDSMFVAGDPNNPHILYKSVTGFPEYFPVEDAAGNVLQLNVSNPGNPIVAITEFRGNILCMCEKSFYEVPVFNGVMLPPNITPATRGLSAINAWCAVDNEIWYLGYDGIWSWDGSQSIKRSEPIDTAFHGFRATLGSVSETAPINTFPTWMQFTRMCYYHGEVHIIYLDVDGLNWEFVFDTRSGRWSQNEKSNGNIGGNEMRILFTEEDTGNLIYIRNGGVICIDDAEETTSYSGGTPTTLNPPNQTADEYTGDPPSGGTVIGAEAITGWMDCGDQYTNKVFDEFLLDYDAVGPSSGNGVVVTVYVDYVWTAVASFVIPAAGSSQRQWFSLVPNQASNTGWSQEAKVIAFAFVFRGGSPARPTLYGMKLRWRPVGTITAGPVYDWNNLGYPWDKRLQNFTIEFDTRSTQRTLILDTISGVNGNNVSTGVATFTFSNAIMTGPGRGLVVLPVSDGTIAKLVRLRADVSTAATSAVSQSNFFRLLNVDFQYTKFPPDVTVFTEPNDFGYPCEKVARNLILQIDTGGVAASIYLIADSVAVGSYSVTTTLDDWKRIIAVQTNPDIIGKLYKLQISPGVGGKAQLFDWSLDFVKEPCQVASVDTFETDFGFNGWKYMYQGWFDYFSSTSLNLSIYKDSGILWYSGTLPAHTAARDVERLYFPILYGSTFNKSKHYRVKITGAQPFKVYSNTKIEWMPWNGDQRSAWQQFIVSPENPLPVG